MENILLGKSIGIIEPEPIEKAMGSAYNSVKMLTPEDQHKRLLDELDEEALSYLEECGKWDDITNSIIYTFFDAARGIVSMYGPKNHQLTFYVNCRDSHLMDYHDGEYDEM